MKENLIFKPELATCLVIISLQELAEPYCMRYCGQLIRYSDLIWSVDLIWSDDLSWYANIFLKIIFKLQIFTLKIWINNTWSADLTWSAHFLLYFVVTFLLKIDTHSYTWALELWVWTILSLWGRELDKYRPLSYLV